MFYYILAGLSLASLAGLIAVFGYQVRANRKKNIDYHELSNYHATSLAVDYLAFKIVHFCRNFVFKSYLFLVHFVKNCISTARYALVRIEKKFNLLAANMPEPEEIHKNANVSSFLKEIKEHKENVMTEIQSGAIAEEIENR